MKNKCESCNKIDKTTKEKLARLEKEREEASKDLFISIDGNLPF